MLVCGKGALMADVATRLARARELHLQSRWAEACDEFAAADALQPLAVDDLEAFAEVAQVLGPGTRQSGFFGVPTSPASTRARPTERSRPPSGWQALIINAEFARANGWVAQVRRLAQERLVEEVPIPEALVSQEHHGYPVPIDNHGWLVITDAYSLIAIADYDAAIPLLSRAAADAARGRQIDLHAFATTVLGRALIKAGRLKEGLSRLDEAMLPVIDGDTSPRARSMLYCAAIATCHEVRELARVREWTLALGAWLDSLPGLGGAYFGNCRIYRSYLLRLCGAWRSALDEVTVV